MPFPPLDTDALARSRSRLKAQKTDTRIHTRKDQKRNIFLAHTYSLIYYHTSAFLEPKETDKLLGTQTHTQTLSRCTSIWIATTTDGENIYSYFHHVDCYVLLQQYIIEILINRMLHTLAH